MRDYGNAKKTAVFWDVEDFPMPRDDDRPFSEMIKSALHNEGYLGPVTSITAYGDEEDKNLGDEIKFVAKRGKCARLKKMLFDIMFWTLDNNDQHEHPIILMVVAKNSAEKTSFVKVFEYLNASDYEVLLAVPDNCAPEQVPVPEVKKIWYWNCLLKAEKPLTESELQALVNRGDRIFIVGRDGVCRACIEYFPAL